MTGKERIIKTLKREKTDRVPVCPIIFTNYVRKYYKNPNINCAEATVKIYEEFGADIIHRNCFPFLYLFAETSGPVSDKWDVKIKEEKSGNKSITNTVIHTPDGDVSIKLESNAVTENETECAYRELPVKDKKDLDKIIKNEPRWEKEFINLLPVVEANSLIKDKGILSPWIQGVFNFAGIYYRKYEELLMDPYVDEGFYKDLMEHCLEQNWSYLKILLDNGVDSFSYSGNLAGGQAGPEFFEKFVLFYEKELIRRIHDKGGFVIYHNCGKASLLFELYAKTDMDCFESLAQTPEGDSELKLAKNTIGKFVCLSGGIDQKFFLVNAKPVEIELKIKETLEIMKPKGGYILSTVDYLSENTPLENIKAFINAGLRYGSLT